MRAEVLDEASPRLRFHSPSGDHFVGRIEHQPVHTVEVVVAAGKAGDVFLWQATGGRNLVMLTPEECRASDVSEAKHRQLTQPQRQLAPLQQKGVVTQKDSGPSWDDGPEHR